MTTTIVLDKSFKKKSEPKKIQFFRYLNENSNALEPAEEHNSPKTFKYIELIAKKGHIMYGDVICDIMFAYDDPSDRSNGIIVVGQWNDGVV